MLHDLWVWMNSSREFGASLNLTTAISCIALPIILAKPLMSRKDIKFTWVIWVFLGFILSRGLVHLLIVWDTYDQNVDLKLVLKIVSALGSLGIYIIAQKFVPYIELMPSIRDILDLNRELQQSVANLQSEKDEKEKAQSFLLQSQKMEAVGQLTGGIAHDFNNLLQAINGNLELIKRNPHSAKVEKWAGTGIDAVARAAHLTSQLLTFSRVQKLQLQESELKPMLKNVMTMITRTIGPDIKVDILECDDVVVNVDSVQLELALLNLALNARDIMPDGGRLMISTVICDDMLDIDVSDTGTGIPEDIISKIFDPFFTTKDIGKGTGLGLSMVYSVAAQFGGEAYIKKTSSKGTTITISLPFTRVLTNTDSETIHVCDEEKDTNKTILIVEDERIIREMMVDTLTSMGYNVEQAEDGVVALSLLKTIRPDLMLIDYAMPVMNGGAVMKAARLIYPDLEIVFATGYSHSSEIEGCRVMKKPFNFEHIESLLNDVFKKTS